MLIFLIINSIGGEPLTPKHGASHPRFWTNLMRREKANYLP